MMIIVVMYQDDIVRPKSISVMSRLKWQEDTEGHWRAHTLWNVRSVNGSSYVEHCETI